MPGCAEKEPGYTGLPLVWVEHPTPPLPTGNEDTDPPEDTGWYQECPAKPSGPLRRLSGTHEVAAIAWAMVYDDFPEYTGFGHSTAGVGDVTGDGLDDVAVVQLRDFAGDMGGVDFLASPLPAGESGSSTLAARLVPDAKDELEGWFVSYFGSMHGLPDVTGDGVSELVVGSGGAFSDWYNHSGAVWVLASPVTSTPGVVLLDESAWAMFLPGYEAHDLGEALDVGDIDGDGSFDLLIGAADYQEGWEDPYVPAFNGAVFAFRGPIQPGTAYAEDALEFHNDGIGSGGFGAQVIATDLTADGVDDVVITRSYGDGEEVGDAAGDALFWEGPIDADQSEDGARARLYGREEADHLGTNANDLGDTDGDGYREVGLGSHVGPAGYGAGSAWLINGMPVGDHGVADLARTRFYGRTTSAVTSFVNSAGDLDLDGRDDVLVGSFDVDGDPRGAAYLFYGAVPEGWYAIDQCADAVILGDDDDPPVYFSAAGDLWGDGTPHLILGSKPGDKAWFVAGGLL